MSMKPVGDTLDSAFTVVGARWKQMAVAVLVVLVPVQILTFLWEVAIDGSTVSGILLGVVTTLLSMVGTTLATAACYQIVVSHRDGQEVGWRESLNVVAGRLGPLIVLAILTGIIVAVGFLLLILPGIWLAVALAFGVPVLLVEGSSATGAMSRSFDLVSGRWWATFGRLLVGFILVFFVTIILAIITIIPFALVFGDDGVGGALANALAGLVASVITTPFLAALVTIVYFDLREQKEGGGMSSPPAPVAGMPPAPAAPPAPSSVPPPGAGWNAPDAPDQPTAPPAPPMPPAPPVPPTGTSATSGSLWSAGDPVAPPEPPAPSATQGWAPPTPEDEPGPSTPPPGA